MLFRGPDLCSNGRRRHSAHAVRENISGYLIEMGGIAVDIGQHAKDIVLLGAQYNAAKLADEDEAMDEFHCNRLVYGPPVAPHSRHRRRR